MSQSYINSHIILVLFFSFLYGINLFKWDKQSRKNFISEKILYKSLHWLFRFEERKTRSQSASWFNGCLSKISAIVSRMYWPKLFLISSMSLRFASRLASILSDNVEINWLCNIIVEFCSFTISLSDAINSLCPDDSRFRRLDLVIFLKSDNRVIFKIWKEKVIFVFLSQAWYILIKNSYYLKVIIKILCSEW